MPGFGKLLPRRLVTEVSTGRVLSSGYLGIMENNMETTIMIYKEIIGYILGLLRIMENEMETAI